MTGTLSLVLAQAPTLRIFIDTCNEDFRHHTSTTEETLQLAIWQPQLLFHSLSKAAHRVPCFRVPVLLLVFELVVQVFADFDVLEHSRQLVYEVCRHPNLYQDKALIEMLFEGISLIFG